VEPLAERHRDGLREAAEREPQVHRFTGMYSLGFDAWFDQSLSSESEVPFVVHVDGRPVGSTRYLNVELLHRRTEIGWTWLERRNLRVRGALLGIGATFEGIFRKHMVLPDSIRDSAWYAIVGDDWPAVKSPLERKIDRHVNGRSRSGG